MNGYIMVSFMNNDSGMTLRITDFRMAGFLLSRGAEFLSTDVRGKQVVFIFCDKNGMAKSILNKYPSSAEQKYDSACKTMHDMVKIALDNR